MERKALLQRFGKKLASLREQRGLSVRELAATAGLRYEQLLRIEAGKVDLLVTTILALAQALEVSPAELMP